MHVTHVFRSELIPTTARQILGVSPPLSQSESDSHVEHVNEVSKLQNFDPGSVQSDTERHSRHDPVTQNGRLDEQSESTVHALREDKGEPVAAEITAAGFVRAYNDSGTS